MQQICSYLNFIRILYGSKKLSQAFVKLFMKGYFEPNRQVSIIFGTMHLFTIRFEFTKIYSFSLRFLYQSSYEMLETFQEDSNLFAMLLIPPLIINS